MASFCAQCAKDLDFDMTDFTGLTTEEDWAAGMATLVLCEGCGPIQVDPQGRCISRDCYEKHGASLAPQEIKVRIVEVLAKYNVRLENAPCDALAMAMERMIRNRTSSQDYVTKVFNP